MMRRTIAIAAVALMLVCLLPVTDVDADAGFDVTDGTGRTFHFDGAAEHIVTAGFATTVTIADAGEIGKIVAVDKYSTYEQSKDERVRDLKALNLGSFYGTSNHESIITNLVKLVDDGKLSLDDPIILTSYSSNSELRQKLESHGFSKVLLWIDITDYDQLIQMVSDVSRIASGGVPDSIKEMDDRVAQVREGVKDQEPVKALHVWYYSGELLVGNGGIMNSMLEVCNADNIGYDPDKGTRYGDKNTILKLLEANPGTVVFVSHSYAGAGHTLDDFYQEMFAGDRTFKVVMMGADWNNWCPESAEGLYSIAQNLYPDVFGEYTPGWDDSGNDVPGWVLPVVAIVIVAVVAVAVVLYMKKP